MESYNASGMPALMLMFPVGPDQGNGIEELPPLDNPSDASAAVYGLDGKKIAEAMTTGEMSSLPGGLYVRDRKKMLVR